ncbi:pseudouridine synthase [Mycoplasmopsis alligatoris]|uniref:Pseudouridine synthase n=1 Tax=Mycoplasmopsis alligatoris A21JP2 TaxID=747682 RepID=D4XVB8_9BACT|nr:pseudouridine synthase [Mycoplasmopsis alligatoris]EFF41663.1 pseudouridylate synthase [Mycoplasmopsis alligatoris A21JP2]
MKLEKFISNVTDLTRSQIKKLLKEKKVFINDNLVTSDSINFKVEKLVIDQIAYNTDEYVYIMLNKPQNYITSHKDELYPSLFNLVSDAKRKNLIAYGRLDVDTEGLLLISDDTESSHKLLSPKHHVEKKYYVEVDKKIPTSLVEIFLNGFIIDKNDKVLPSKLLIISDNKCYLTIKEGKFHQVKRMFKTHYLNVTFLKRIEFNNLKLDETLKPGQWRYLTKKEVELLLKF